MLRVLTMVNSGKHVRRIHDSKRHNTQFLSPAPAEDLTARSR